MSTNDFSDKLPIDLTKVSKGAGLTAVFQRTYKRRSFRCVGCKKKFILTAEVQKRIYENVRLNFHAPVTRCKNCQTQWKRHMSFVNPYFNRPIKQAGLEEIEKLAHHIDMILQLGGTVDVDLRKRVQRRYLALTEQTK